MYYYVQLKKILVYLDMVNIKEVHLETFFEKLSIRDRKVG